MIHASQIYQNQFGTDNMRAVWTEDAMLQAWLDVEAAVAGAQGELKVLSKADAREIVRNCNTRVITPEAVAAQYRETGHVIVSLIKAFREAVPGAGERFHLGMTTQDVLDTGLTLQIRHALRLLVPAMFGLEDALVDLAIRHRKTVMAGRSEGQQGAPITFGYKIAVFASEVGAHIERLNECAGRLIILTLFGAMGVQSSYCMVVGKERMKEFMRLVAGHLDFEIPIVCPHQRTDRFAELGHVLALICSTLGKLGLEIRDLQRTEVGEAAEPWRLEQFSSSTLPQKQNPEVSEWWQGLARLARGASVALTEVHQQHERDISRLAPELHAIPNLFLYAASAIKEATRIVSGLQVHGDRMWGNLMMGGGLTMAESVMLGLAEKSGRKVWAHQLVHDVAIEVATHGGDFADIIVSHPEVSKHLGKEEVAQLLRPEHYIGTAVEQVNAVRTSAKRRRKKLNKELGRVLGTRF